MARDLKYGKVTVQNDSKRHPLNKSDEIVVVFRVQDELLTPLLARYENLARAIEDPDKAPSAEWFDHLANVQEAVSEWQADNPARVKIPD